MTVTRPPIASQNSVTRLIGSEGVRSVGVRITVAPLKRSARATENPERFEPAMGWLPTKPRGRDAPSASAALTMPALVLPTSVRRACELAASQTAGS